ncbi:MAG: formyltetrahydrofolate deformylase [Acidimicrobiia bacterium]
MNHAVLLISCADQPGIVAGVADFVFRHRGNIVAAEQYTDHADGTFFQRVEFELDQLDLARDQIEPAFAEVAERFAMHVQLRFTDDAARVGILVSKQPHCLDDLLARWRTGELGPAQIPVVISNHPDHEAAVHHAGAAYSFLPVDSTTRAEQEEQLLRVLARHGVVVVVLGRYMQVLSPRVLATYPNGIINIHHSVLPAFLGGRPYHQAHARGVKLIGATAHYATEELDEGPIIDQDVARVSHRDSVEDLARRGRDLERVVLARALRAHLQHRVLTHRNKTVVFE